MREEEVPQDDSYYDGHLRACYAVDRQGRYVLVTSRGWQAETVATAETVAHMAEHLESVRADVEAGRLSPLAYHMTARLMTPHLLAASCGLYRWRVKRHLRPGVFSRLPERLLIRYAECLDVPLERLSTIPDRARAAPPG